MVLSQSDSNDISSCGEAAVGGRNLRGRTWQGKMQYVVAVLCSQSQIHIAVEIKVAATVTSMALTP